MENKQTTTYKLTEAVKLLPENSKSKFIGSVDIDLILNLKEKQKKESVRGNVTLPHQFSEEKSVVVLCDTKDSKKALAAGASHAGLEDVMEELLQNKIKFDVVIATPDVMPKIIKLGKVLGPKGLMPNPKNGTVTTDIETAVSKFKSGTLSFKMNQDQQAIRAKVAKLDMKPEEIEENIKSFVKGVLAEARRLNPNPFKKITVSPTMGTGIKLDVSDIMSQIK